MREEGHRILGSPLRCIPLTHLSVTRDTDRSGNSRRADAHRPGAAADTDDLQSLSRDGHNDVPTRCVGEDRELARSQAKVRAGAGAPEELVPVGPVPVRTVPVRTVPAELASADCSRRRAGVRTRSRSMAYAAASTAVTLRCVIRSPPGGEEGLPVR